MGKHQLPSPAISAATGAESKGEATTLFDHSEIRNALQRIFSRLSFDLFVIIWTQYLELRIGMPLRERSLLAEDHCPAKAENCLYMLRQIDEHVVSTYLFPEAALLYVVFGVPTSSFGQSLES